MSEYRRWYVPGATYFFTVVTFERRRLFDGPAAVQLLGQALRAVRESQPFRTVAIVVLPDHLHCVWTLPAGDADFSDRWRRIKREFAFRWVREGGLEGERSPTRHNRGERAVWQRRFWEHRVRDEADLERYCDYVHFNPIKHGLVSAPRDWPWSTFTRFVRDGQYSPRWGESEPPSTLRGDGDLKE